MMISAGCVFHSHEIWMAITWCRSHGGHMAVTWRSHGGQSAIAHSMVTFRWSLDDYSAITRRLLGDHPEIDHLPFPLRE